MSGDHNCAEHAVVVGTDEMTQATVYRCGVCGRIFGDLYGSTEEEKEPEKNE